MARPQTTRAFELIDPRRPDLPRFITKHPWRPRWRLRHLDGSRVAEWFRSLDKAGMMPAESHRWLPNVAMSYPEAERLVRRRIETVARWAGCWPMLPPWLLVEHYRRPEYPCRSVKPIVRLHPDGRREIFGSMVQAARARRWTYEAIRHFVCSGNADSHGCFYFVAPPRGE